MTSLLIKIYASDKKRYRKISPRLTHPTNMPLSFFSKKKKKKTHGIILGPHLMLSDSQYPHVLNN